MSLRKQARQLVVQMLYQVDLNPEISAGEVRRMIDEHGHNKTVCTFAWQLFTGVMEYQKQIDELIVRVAENWTLKRMAVTDRNILRLGVYELLHTDTPASVIMDEAIELAREFGSAHNHPSSLMEFWTNSSPEKRNVPAISQLSTSTTRAKGSRRGRSVH